MAIKVGLASLGCAKNLVDSELILGFLREGGIEVCEDLGEAEVAIVNTCAFIAEAERESAGIIRRLEGLKSQGLIGRIVVAGCLPARRGSRVGGRFPGVDRVIRQADIPHVAAIVRSLGSGPRGAAAVPAAGQYLYDHSDPRLRLTPPHYAYLKIGEGCDNRCSYCLIPSIRGPFRSRSPRLPSRSR